MFLGETEAKEKFAIRKKKNLLLPIYTTTILTHINVKKLSSTRTRKHPDSLPLHKQKNYPTTMQDF